MKKSVIFLVLLVVISILGVIYPAVPTAIVTEGINSGDTAWMLAATALVLLMTPGLAYFYGGMIDTKNIISTMLQSFIAMGVISVLWIVVGFSLAFGFSLRLGFRFRLALCLNLVGLLRLGAVASAGFCRVFAV